MPRAENNHGLRPVPESDIAAACIICEIQVVGLRREFSCQSIYLLDERFEIEGLALFPDHQLLDSEYAGYLYVGETLTFGFLERSKETSSMDLHSFS